MNISEAASSETMTAVERVDCALNLEKPGWCRVQGAGASRSRMK